MASARSNRCHPRRRVCATRRATRQIVFELIDDNGDKTLDEKEIEEGVGCDFADGGINLNVVGDIGVLYVLCSVVHVYNGIPGDFTDNPQCDFGEFTDIDTDGDGDVDHADSEKWNAAAPTLVVSAAGAAGAAGAAASARFAQP